MRSEVICLSFLFCLLFGAERADSVVVEFRCVANCRSETVSFTLFEDNVLEERWGSKPDANKSDWIVRYRRVDWSPPRLPG